MRPPVTSLVIQTWKDQGRPKPWKQASMRSSSPDSTDSDGAASDERERDHVALPSRAEQNVFQNSVDASDPGLKSSSTTLLGREPSRSGVLVRGDLRALRYGAHQVMAPSLVRSYSVDSGLSLSVQAKHANIQFLRHHMRNSLHRDGCLHERIPHFYSSSNIHKSRLNGFSHPPVYPKQPPNHRVQLHGGCGLDPRAPERLSRSMSHMEGLVITDLVSSSMPRSRSMDSELTLLNAALALHGFRVNGERNELICEARGTYEFGRPARCRCGSRSLSGHCLSNSYSASVSKHGRGTRSCAQRL